MTHDVFVYGSLRRGQGNNRLLDGAEFVSPATVCGSLYSLGGFPGLRLDDAADDVVGEVWRVDDATLADLDRLEGVAVGFYSRRRARVRHGKASLGLCWVYEIARQHVAGLNEIPGGDWVRFKQMLAQTFGDDAGRRSARR